MSFFIKYFFRLPRNPIISNVVNELFSRTKKILSENQKTFPSGHTIFKQSRVATTFVVEYTKIVVILQIYIYRHSHDVPSSMFLSL